MFFLFVFFFVKRSLDLFLFGTFLTRCFHGKNRHKERVVYFRAGPNVTSLLHLVFLYSNMYPVWKSPTSYQHVLPDLLCQPVEGSFDCPVYQIK